MKPDFTTVGELAKQLGCQFSGDSMVRLRGANAIEVAEPDELTFLSNPKYKKHLPTCRAGAVIIGINDQHDDNMACLLSKNPYDDFRRAIDIIYGAEPDAQAMGIHPSAHISVGVILGENVSIGVNVVIAENASVGDRCVLMPGAYVGKNSILGNDCHIGVNVSIRHNVILGDRVWVGDGTVLGYDGFGYVRGSDGYQRIRPVGQVVLEDDVHLGANCCVDHATVGATRIGKGTKLDNLIQIAHGVELGENTVIAAQTGISGSTKIGNWVTIAGQVGIVGHIDVADGCILGAQSGITKSTQKGVFLTGTPARPMMEMRRMEATMKQLPALLKRVKELEEKLAEK